MLAPEGSSKGLTAVVPDGWRAVTLEINEVSGVAGLLVQGLSRPASDAEASCSAQWRR